MVKLGLIAPFEELYRDDGYAALHAVRLAISQRNAAGGVAGRQVALVALNDNGRPDEARQQAANLGVDGDVLGVIGPLHGDTAQQPGRRWPPRGCPGSHWPAWRLSSSRAASPWRRRRPLAGQASEMLAADGVSGPVALAGDAMVAGDLAGVIWLGDAAGGADLRAALTPGTALIGGPELGSPVFAGRAGEAADGCPG